MKLHFTKMHGLGNDYVYVDCVTRGMPDDPAEISQRVSPRHTAVGADGLILITPSDIADFGMRIFNADGSEAQMCGNGSRCVGKYVFDHGLTDRTDITLETLSGVKHLQLHVGNDGRVETVTVDMGEPEFEFEKIPFLGGPQMDIQLPQMPFDTEEKVSLVPVSMGNPHGVVFLSEGILEKYGDQMVPLIGPILESNEMWPQKANIEFAEVEDCENIRMRVWERGSGETMACGTGACATAVAAMKNGLTDNHVNVHLLGGTLQILWNPETNHVEMTGPATEVFEGSMDI